MVERGNVFLMAGFKITGDEANLIYKFMKGVQESFSTLFFVISFYSITQAKHLTVYCYCSN